MRQAFCVTPAVVGGQSAMSLLARVYDATAALERDALQAALELAEVVPSDRVLDLATGTGALLRELARRGGRPSKVIGLDRSRAMLSGAAGLPAEWVLMAGDARALPFADATFDVVTVCYVLHLLDAEDRRRTLEETVRVVRGDGRVVVVTVDGRRPAVRWLLGKLPRWTGLHRLDPRPELEAAGLQVVRSRYPSGGWPSLCLLSQRSQRSALR